MATLRADDGDQSSNGRAARWLTAALHLPAALPLIATLMFLSVVARARVRLGFWPYDPFIGREPIFNPEYVFPLHFHATFVLILAALFCLLVCPFVFMWRARVWPIWLSVVYAMGCLLFAYTLFGEPFGWTAWFFD